MSTQPVADLRARGGAEAAHGSAARQMFDRIAPTYDVLNRLMSAGLDRRWRAKAVAEVAAAPEGPVLDLCAGTMDLTAMVARVRPRDRVFALDFSASMLELGRHKAPAAEVVVGDATSLPFFDRSFAAVICGFGMRNLSDPAAGAREVARVLRPGGRFVTLELFRPTRLATKAFHKTYARVVLPALGGWLSGEPGAYRYLAGSMAGFYTRAEYERVLSHAGFVRVRGRELTLGVASIVCGEVQG
ncbi:MAG TPA: ubiquinone/menaquinone biosynthesis methyltransferase [Polyangiaceae bacterium]|nr:ubiquinone/menaquinone biosynthesis methyltransferase [Polyangiaceae bacterium]